MKKLLIVAALFAATLVSASSAWACSLAANQDFIIDSMAQSIEFMDFSVKAGEIKRGADSGSSCDDLGWVQLEFTDADPRVGYTIVLLTGDPLENLSEYPEPIIPAEDGTVMLVWSEAMDDDQPAFEFIVRVTAIGPDGTEGPFQDVVVSHDGVEGGCSSTGTRDSSVLGVFLFAAAMLLRRRAM